MCDDRIMGVSIKLHNTLIAPLEHWQKSMTHYNPLLFPSYPYLDLFASNHFFKKTVKDLTLWIVIAPDQMNSAIEGMNYFTCVRCIHAAKHIPYDKNVISFRNSRVPPINHL